MDLQLRAPRNRTAELQLIQRLVSQGYVLWTADRIPLNKLTGFVGKWHRYRLLGDPAARAYRKRCGRANSHLVLESRFNELNPETDAAEPVHWLLLGTPGRDGLGDGQPGPGPVVDAGQQGQHILWMGYELVRQSKHFTDAEGRLRHEVTWTWRLPSRRYREFEALLISAARDRDYGRLNQTFLLLGRMPLFSGIRQQVLRLHVEANRMLKKVRGNQLPQLELPFMTLLPIWPENGKQA